MTEVIRDPAIMSGEPTVSGTRILATTILSYLRHGSSADEIFRDYPSLPIDGIDAVTRWAEATYGADWRMPPFSLENYELQRDPDETDEEYAARRALFENLDPAADGASEHDIEARSEAVRFAIANNVIEGGHVLPETEAALDEWARGEIDDDELMERTLKRFGPDV